MYEPLTSNNERENEDDVFLKTDIMIVSNKALTDLPPPSSDHQFQIEQDSNGKVIKQTRVISCTLIVDKAIYINTSELLSAWDSKRVCCGEIKVWINALGLKEVNNERKLLTTIKKNILTFYHHPKAEFVGSGCSHFISILLQGAHVPSGAWTVYIAAAIFCIRVIYNRNKYREFLQSVQKNFKTLISKSEDSMFSRIVEEKVMGSYRLTIVEGRIVEYTESRDASGSTTTCIGETYPFGTANATFNVQHMVYEHRYSEKLHSWLMIATVGIFVVLIIIQFAS